MYSRKCLRWTVAATALCGLLFAPPAAFASIEMVDLGVSARPSPVAIEGIDLAVVANPSLNSASPSVAGLTFEAIGDPIPGGSWYQQFAVHSPTSFTNLGMMLWNGYPALEGSPAMDFSFAGATAGWQETYGPATGATWPIAASMGTATTDLVWQAHFADPINQGFTMTLFTYDDLGGNVFEGAMAMWDGEDWSYIGIPNGYSWEIYQSTVAGAPVVPVPSALLLGGIGLAAVGAIRRRLL